VIVLVTRGKLNALFSITFATGDIWMLMGAFVWSVYSLLLKRKPQDIKAVTFQYSTFILGLLFLLPFFLWETSSSPQFVVTPRIVLSVLYIGVVSSLVAYYLWNRSVEIIGPSKAAIIFYTSPLFIGLLAFIFLKETIGMIHLYSAFLIIPGILAANYEPKQDRSS
jgi:drug/metabolite transporter (DMT)-like permease